MTEPRQEHERQIADVLKQLAELDGQRERLTARLEALQKELHELTEKEGTSPQAPLGNAPVTNASPASTKLELLRRLFKGREDVYARRWESAKTGKAGYSPACCDPWAYSSSFGGKGRRTRPDHSEFLPFTDTVWRDHIRGYEQLANGGTREFVAGVFPMLVDETCSFLAVDFDKGDWQSDAGAFMGTCCSWEIPAALERSRSGAGAHVWIFFAQAVSARLARQLGAYLITETMQRRPELGFGSYDRLFPNQDTMPAGGFGNLIALPLQGAARKQGNTLFIDDHFAPYPDQWAFLSSIRQLELSKLEEIVQQANQRGGILGVRLVVNDGHEEEPWLTPPSHSLGDVALDSPLPDRIELVLGNQIYIGKDVLSPSLRNKLIRLAAFQNPEFYKAQAMRLSVFGKPRIVSCAQDLAKHLALPRGLLGDVNELLLSLGVAVEIRDERASGQPLDVHFTGTLTARQAEAAAQLLKCDTGVLAASTAFGKTVVAINLLALRGVNTLILVHRQQLLEQWVARLESFLDVSPKQIGRIGAGKRKPTGLIDVALIQGLCRKGVVDDIVGQYGQLIVDECHHISAVSFEQVARECKAKYVLGLSATPIRKDGHHPIIFMQCGSVRFKDSAADRAVTQPFAHQFIVRQTGFELPPELATQEHPAIQEIYRCLVVDEARNAMIIEDIVAAIRVGRHPIVITERTQHLGLLAAALRKHVPNVVELKGAMGVRQRRGMLARLAETTDASERVIVATGRYLGEGFDEARLDTLFLTMPISWKGTLQQYAGRLHRQHAGKHKVQIYDYADLAVSVLARMHQKRLAGYRALGYELVEQ